MAKGEQVTIQEVLAVEGAQSQADIAFGELYLVPGIEDALTKIDAKTLNADGIVKMRRRRVAAKDSARKSKKLSA